MFKLSNKERYAVQALVDLAFHQDGTPTQIKDIASRQRIPPRFLEQIFQDLKRAGLIDSKRGPRGGYRLTRPSRDIVLGDVLRATTGPIASALGGGAKRAKSAAKRAKGGRSEEADLREATDQVFREIAGTIERCFDNVTLEDVCVRGEELGLPRRSSRVASGYVI